MTVGLGLAVTDDSGYAIRQEDLAFLRLNLVQLAAAAEHRLPLGVDESSFEYFVTSLADALAGSQVTSCDVRLQGSAAHVFSGRHKTMPWSRVEIAELYLQLQERAPQDFEIDRVLLDLATLWPPEAPSRPRRRLFDVLHRLRVDPSPSDIDVQISSDELYDLAANCADHLGQAHATIRVDSETYGFVRKPLIRRVAPALGFWADEQRAILQRMVSVAVFPGSGPPQNLGVNDVSSHFRDEDWKLDLGPMTVYE